MESRTANQVLPTAGSTWSVSIDGDTAAIASSGEVLIYNKVNGQLERAQTLQEPTDTNMLFGSRVELSGDWLMVSDPDYGLAIDIPGNSDTFADNIGAVFAYQRQTDSWTLAQTITQEVSPVLAQTDRFGFDFDLSEDQLIIGSRDAKAFFWELGSGTWGQASLVEAIDVDRDANTALFGWSVAIDGSLATVGAPAYAIPSINLTTGAAFIFNSRTHTGSVRGAGNDRIGNRLVVSEGRLLRTSSRSSPGARLSYLQDTEGTWRTSAAPTAGFSEPSRIDAASGFYAIANDDSAEVHVHQTVRNGTLLDVVIQTEPVSVPLSLADEDLSGIWHSFGTQWLDRECVHSSSTLKVSINGNILLIGDQLSSCTDPGGLVSHRSDGSLFFTISGGDLLEDGTKVGTISSEGIELTSCASANRCTDLKLEATPVDGRLAFTRVERDPTADLTIFEISGFLTRTGDAVLTPTLLTFRRDSHVFEDAVGGVPIGSTEEDQILLHNDGEQPATNIAASIGRFYSSGTDQTYLNFSFVGDAYPGTDGTCGQTLDPLSSCILHLQVNAPGGTGANQRGRLTVTYDDQAGAPQMVELDLEALVYNP